MSEMIGVIFFLIFVAIVLGVLCAMAFGAYIFVKKVIVGSTPAASAFALPSFPGMWAGESLFMRIFVGFILIFASLMPLAFVQGLVVERGALYQGVAERMASEWSGPQQVSGPVLIIPYEFTTYVMDRIENRVTGEVKNERRAVNNERLLLILPDTLEIDTNLETEELRRGIYRVPIYSSKTHMKGAFKWPDLTLLDHKPEKFIWDRAVLTVLINEAKGIQGGTSLKWNGALTELGPGLGLASFSTAAPIEGVHARLKLDESMQTTSSAFELTLNLRGSSSFAFAPTGKESSVKLAANWGDPSFQGKLLPASREISENAFSADWSISHLSRSYEHLKSFIPGQQDAFLQQLKDFSLGANLFNTVNLYTLLERTTKYGIMFIGLTFFSIFIVEFASGARMHVLQHLIIGSALSMFYLCVLAFSEHIPFGYAYLIGMGLITAIVGCYAWFAVGRLSYGLTLSGVMIALYSVLYSILQMEDYALLIGTMLLFSFLVLGMYVTRNIGQKPLNEVTTS